MKLASTIGVLLFCGGISTGFAALVWADHGSNHQYYSTVWDYNTELDPDYVLSGSTSLGSISSTFSATREYWFNTGYRNSGSFYWARPGYVPNSDPSFLKSSGGYLSGLSTLGEDYQNNNLGLPPIPDNALLAAKVWEDGLLTVTTSFSGLEGGVLPAGSWIYFDGIINDEILTVDGSASGWADAFVLMDQKPDLVSANDGLFTFQGTGSENASHQSTNQGGVLLRTSAPLSSLTWTVQDPTFFSDTDTGQNTTSSFIRFGVIVNVPEPATPAFILLTGGLFLIKRGRGRRG